MDFCPEIFECKVEVKLRLHGVEEIGCCIFRPQLAMGIEEMAHGCTAGG